MKPSVKNPYYIVAPAYTSKSAGISLLYKLCHLLNTKNCRAFIICRDAAMHEYPFQYAAPLLSQNEAIQHINFRFNPIVVMPETGFDKLHYPCTFRYLMNYIGIFPGEPKETDLEFQIDKKYFWAFSTDIAKKHNIPHDKVLFTPIVETDIFYRPQVEDRQGKACYLGKYAELYSRKLPKKVDKSFYIFYRNKNIGHTPEKEKYAEKLRMVEFLYVYENTSVITEALMCGCPVVCVPNQYCQFTENDMIGFYEIGLNGIAIGTNPKELERAKATVHLARERILTLMNQFEGKIDYFIQETQKISQETRLNKDIAIESIANHFHYAPHKKSKLTREFVRIFRNINPFQLKPIFLKEPYVLQSLFRRLKQIFLHFKN